jgi:hypothetical protein
VQAVTGLEPSPLLPLPIRPRPAAGEPVSSYVRRLARANHLRPSYLHGYLAGPPDYLPAISPQRLAALSGRPAAVLERTLTGLTRPGRVADTPGQPARRVTRAAGKPGLFAAIRRDAHDGHSIRALAARHRVHRRTIRQALAGPVPPPRKTPQRTSALDRLHGPIMAMLTADPAVPVRQVWERLLDEHDAAISYARVRDYVTGLRAGLPGQGT